MKIRLFFLMENLKIKWTEEIFKGELSKNLRFPKGIGLSSERYNGLYE